MAIALGSNLGDRRAHLVYALEQISTVVENLRISSILETEPVEVDGPQPPYLNAVAVGKTTLAPADLLVLLLAIERARGRERPAPRAPRTLDLDLILYGPQRIQAPGLVVPHPRYRTRTFVLQPLAEVAPDWLDPETGQTMAQLLDGLKVHD